ncbi:hypothetical protein BC829DRAFT_8751 [Chytridium lagenaria]|nr:hypothetical protein BC829DRAFT_8751 [Chytridium lagenaria]
MQAAGNQCTGENLRYIDGYMSLFAMNIGYMIIRPTDYMQNTVKCAKILTGIFDHYTKTGRITVDDINNRRTMAVAGGNITQLINNASVSDQYGRTVFVDSAGDVQMEQDIWSYKLVNVSSRKQGVQGVTVGRWWRNNSVIYNMEPFSSWAES